MIDLENLTKTFPGSTVSAVDGLNLHVDRCEIVVFVGPSGCGKTTTLKMINRLIEPTWGTIKIDGQSVEAVPVHELRRGIG
jgi:osmoprotectant transport system ATP-binding protein